jgi:hypothetical protein
MVGMLNGTPKHKTRKNQCATNTHANKSCKSATFWEEECSQLIRRREVTLFKLKEFPTRKNVLSYKKKEANAESGLRKIKKEYFKEIL